MPRKHDRPDSGMENAFHPDFDPEAGTVEETETDAEEDTLSFAEPYPGGNEPGIQTQVLLAVASHDARKAEAIERSGVRMRNPHELKLVISGQCGAGKTVLLSLVAHLLNEAMQRHQLGPNIRLAYHADEEFRSLDETFIALKALTGESGPGLSIFMETNQTYGPSRQCRARWVEGLLSPKPGQPERPGGYCRLDAGHIQRGEPHLFPNGNAQPLDPKERR